MADRDDHTERKPRSSEQKLHSNSKLHSETKFHSDPKLQRDHKFHSGHKLQSERSGGCTTNYDSISAACTSAEVVDRDWDSYLQMFDSAFDMKEEVFDKRIHRPAAEYLADVARENKIAMDKTPKPFFRPLLPKFNRCHEELRLAVSQAPISRMARAWRKLVTRQLPRRLLIQFPNVANTLFSDIDCHYAEANLYISMNNKIIPKPEEEMEKPLFEFKFQGRTERYLAFVEKCDLLEHELFITTPLMRKLQNASVADLPDSLIDFSKFRGPLKVKMDMLLVRIQDELQREKERLISPLYADIVKEIKSGLGDDLSRIPDPMWLRYINAARYFVGLRVTELLCRTLENLMYVVGDVALMPFFKFNMNYVATLKLNPPISSIFQFYHNIADDIASYSQKLICMDTWANPSYDCTRAQVYVPVFLKENAHNQIDIRLQKLFRPMVEHMANIIREYQILFEDEMENEIQAFLEISHEFDEFCEKVSFYDNYNDRVSWMDWTIFFEIGMITQVATIETLHECIERYINRIIQQIIIQNETVNHSICREFELLTIRALKVPKNTEQLVETGQYMLWVRSVQLVELHERMAIALDHIMRLIEMTTLSQKNIDLNSETITWLERIKPILDTHNCMFEQRKGELEEILMKTVIKLEKDLQAFLPLLVLLDDMSECDNSHDYCDTLRSMTCTLQEFERTLAWANAEEKLMKITPTAYPELEECKTIIYPFYDLVFLCAKWRRHFSVWMDGPWENIRINVVEETIEEYLKEFQKHQKNFRTKIRVHIAEKYPRRFKGSVEDKDIHKQPAPLKLCAKMLQYLRDFRPLMQIITIMRNTALLQRHWDDMSSLVGEDITPDAGTTLRKIHNKNFVQFMESFDIISIGATKELALKVGLAKMKDEWVDICFKTNQYKETGISVLTGIDDVQAVLDDHIMKTLSMRGSAFVKPIEAEVKEWYERISRVNASIEEWGKVQCQWMYLLPIFSSKDIVNQMPEEGALFKEVDNTFKRYMSTVDRDPHVIETAAASGLLEAFRECSKMLDRINEGVTNYLEKKRVYFPRFFFLSNDEMLEILSETKDPLRVQPHLRKCFEGICKLQFDKKLVIHAMFSQEGERVEFLTHISTEDARGSVEKWLVQVEEQMTLSVREEIFHSKGDYEETKRVLWVSKWEGQVVLCVSQIFWTKEAEYCLRARSVPELNTFYLNLVVQLNEIVGQVRSPVITNLTRITIKALIVIDVHAKDVIQELVSLQVNTITDFQWLAQLRYYWQDDAALVRIINATVNYAYEYLGNSDRLVITPLTDRCYRTLVGAYQLHLNGAPEGPAGTGKTETTKDLAKALAVQCVVFNCSDGLDYKAMGKFFKGLAAAGAWVCFDEFNRIELEVLSVVAQQILCIVLAVRAHQETFIFEGTELVLKPTCYVCITMNPGYAGRSELPDNLKVLFRTVAMMVPDYAMIGEISLYSYGFVDARKLSVKIVQTYRLCSEQLSSQNHYDYGMRAVKTVLSAAGNNKRAFPDENEDIILLRSITDVNLPKFLSFDVPLFGGIISDLFPGITLPLPDYNALMPAVFRACDEMVLQPIENFLLKVIQMYEMMIVRHGFMLVGEPFGGKTKTMRVLAAALSYICEQGKGEAFVQFQTINPKSITMGQLYGLFDPVSYEWTDGVVATCFRNFAMDPCPDRKWVIFDGPVDAVWIENMNTVLDDNKKLCLMSGEVIAMTNTMSMIFEVMDLSQASPATVSRCGMIYTEPVIIGWRAVVMSWIQTSNPLWADDKLEFFMEVFEWLLPPIITFVRKTCHQLCFGGEINSVMSTVTIIEMLMNGAVRDNPDESKHINSWFQAALLTGGVWGIGGTLDSDSRAKFDDFYRQIWRNESEDVRLPQGLDISCPLPGDGMFLDYYYVFRMKGSWKYWPDDVRQMPIMESKSLSQTLVPTLDVARYMYLLKLHITFKKPMLIIGPTGTGKTFYIQNLLMKRLPMSQYEPCFITFTVQISAAQTQELIISKLSKLKRGKYGPPKGKESIIFVDDMNLPAKEIYGAQPPIELLRQYFDHGHWYDFKDTSKIFLYDILFLGAMGPVGGSRQDIYQRFLRHFNIYSINDFSDESMFKIFTNTLLQGLKRNGFAQDVMMHVIYIVNATIDIYKAAMLNLRPTPAKSHYIFNLRDFARVIIGCSMIKKDSAGDSKSIFVRLWAHEVLRVFCDRLIDDEGRLWLFEKIRASVKDFFKQQFDVCFENLPRDQNGKISMVSFSDLLFGTYIDLDAPVEERKYEEIASMETFVEIAETCLDDYNATHKTKMNVVLFRYALEHLSKICRILSMPCGSGLLVGVGGSGRQSVTRLAATICGFATFQPEITKNYGIVEWRDDLKKVLKETGGLGKDLVFLFNEGQIKEEIFLQDIDGLLNSGEVPNIYAIDEKQEILEMCRLAAQGGNRALDVGLLEVFSFFTNRCKEKLHMILCFSPIGPALRTRLRLYPALVNCCTIDWFEGWPENALEMVADRYMADVDLPDAIKKASVVACKQFHVGARELSDQFYAKFGRKTYITSASYLDLIRSFTELMTVKQETLTTARNRYLVGLEQLAFAAEQVAIMQVELNELKPKLIVMANTCTEMMAVIEHETAEVEKTSVLVRADEEAANIQAAGAQALKSECEADLALALPILEEAVAALNTLKPADITLVKAMKNPPDAVKLVMAAVCVMKNIQPDKVPDPASGKKILDYWGPSKRILGDMNFLQQLKDYDKDNIPVAIMTKIRKEYLTNANFVPAIVAKASTAAQGLCKWIIALDLYDKVAKVVGPKKEKLGIAEAQFAATMAILTEKRNMLQRLEAQLADLNKQLTDANAEMARLHLEVALCTEKLYRAEKLIGGLGGEKTRWLAAAETLANSYESLPGDLLISCGIIAYLAPFTLQVRWDTIQFWHDFVESLDLPCSPHYSLLTILGSEIKIQTWCLSGLPNDSFSTDNAIIMDTSKRCSLLVDPQGQANGWIKTMEKKNKLQVVKFTDSNYMKVMEHCLEFGQPILIESILEVLEAPIDPILERKTFFQGPTEYIALGETVIEYSPRFKLYLTTTLRNPHYLPEVFNKITLINFALTLEGLEDQLLGIVVAKERPDLQEKRQQLIVESAENKSKLKDVEEMILRTLSETKGNILEDQTAIDILDSSKRLSEDITKKQAYAKETEIKIDASRESYKPMAKHSAVLYYCVSELPSVDPMYQYSLNWFINLYIKSIGNASKSNDLDKRLKFLIATFDYDLYNNVCRSLFERDKLLFAFILYSKLALAAKKINSEMFSFLLTGASALDNPFPNPGKGWLSEKSWYEVCQIEEFKAFDGIKQCFAKNIKQWQFIYEAADPQECKLPPPYETTLTRFEKLLIIRILRPDKTIVAVTKCVAAELGEKFISPPPFDIARSYLDSSFQFPLIFILSPGVDPMAALCSFAEKMGFDDKFRYISLGQGQGPIAQAMISQAQVDEHWVCLQNCHLAVSWMSRLEKICESFDSTNTRKGFRLWLTSYPSDMFPIAVLQNGVKMTNEPPTGLSQNLLRSYLSEPLKEEEFYGGCPEKDDAFHKLLYGMCFFHAVIQERRTFGPIGWNIPYGFNESDFHISVRQLQMFINEYAEVPYVAIKYLAGECNYGGRVTDDWDRRVLTTILNDFINPKVLSDPKYTFVDAGSVYCAPKRTEFDEVINFIKALPPFHPPEVFGLHMNAGIRRDLRDSMMLLDSALVVQGKGGAAGGSGAETMLFAIVNDILSRLPPIFDLEEASLRYPTCYTESMNTVLCQEMLRFNRLYTEIQTSLINIQKACKGIVVMSPQLEVMSSTMLLGKLPPSWAKVSYPSLKSLSGYIGDFIQRLDFLYNWYYNGKPPNFWLSGFFFTQAFLTGAKQNYARKYVIPIDQLVFDFEVLRSEKGGTPPPADGIHIYGLFLEGARWEKSKMTLDEQKPKVLYESLPAVWLKPIHFDKYKLKGRYISPLYKTSERRGTLSTTGHSTNYVLPFLLDTKKPTTHWVKRSVALLCQLD